MQFQEKFWQVILGTFQTDSKIHLESQKAKKNLDILTEEYVWERALPDIKTSI